MWLHGFVLIDNQIPFQQATPMSQPTISVIMPCFNGEPHLELSTGSVRAQTFADWELIVVDDGSTDGSWAMLQRLAAEDHRLRVFRQDNTGPATARNRGLREARGEFIAFLDSDDTWNPLFMEKMLTALETTPGADLAYCGWQNLGLPGGRGIPFVPPEYEGPGKLDALLENCRWPIHGALTRAATIREEGGFDDTLTSCMDFDLWLKIGSAHGITRVSEVLAFYHHHEGEQITKNPLRLALNHLRVQENFVNDYPRRLTTLPVVERRSLIYGELLRRGYESYWRRDLKTARAIFRRVMRAGYGKPKDWLYMLPALLPIQLHTALLGKRDSAAHSTQGPR
jgi:glycosyltransferase involved in cell wall biosynthesis